jgi:uncharacterized membrane protein YcgQ (UPF0703/DUF1980 family)
MRLELFILSATLFFMYNTYHDGKYINMLFGYKKYYAMAVYFLLGVGLITILRRNPQQGKAMIYQANTMIKYLPFDKHAKTLITPMLDLTQSSMSSSSAAAVAAAQQKNTKQIPIGTKRSVSETKKKFVAARMEMQYVQKSIRSYF